MLAQFALAFEPREANLDAHDLTQLFSEKVRGRVAHLPGVCLTGLVLPRESADHTADELLVVANVERAVGMDHLVIPRRHAPVRLMLAGVPVGRDVAVRAAEDHEHRRSVGQLAPQRIGSGHMREQPAAGALLGIEQEGQVVGVEARGGLRHQHGQGVLAHDAMQLFHARFGELSGQIHVAITP